MGQERDDSGVAFRTPDGKLLCGMSEGVSDDLFCEVSPAVWPAPNDREPDDAHAKHSNNLAVYPDDKGKGEDFAMSYIDAADLQNSLDASLVNNELWWKPSLPSVRVGKASTPSAVIPEGVTLTNGLMRCAREGLDVYCQLRPNFPIYHVTATSISIAKAAG